MESLRGKRNIKPFDGEKYSVWKFRIRALLIELNVIKVIDDEMPNIPTDEWKQAERTAKGVIIEYLADSFVDFAKTENNAKDVFKGLDAIYERKSIATQLAIRKRLLSLKLIGDTSLQKHFRVFDELIAELSAAGANLGETDKVSHLLLTLPASYEGVITAIETLSEDNLTLSFVKTRLLDHEIKLKSESSDTSAKILQAYNDSTQNYKRNRFAFSKNYKQIKNKRHIDKSTKKVSMVKCYHCGRKGHLKKNCYHYKRTYQKDNVNTAQTVRVVHPTMEDNTTGFAFIAGSHQSEIQNNMTFILDSGASDHLINQDNLFTNYIELQPPLKISIAKNGMHINAIKRGTIDVITETGIQGQLVDVLYCPEVPYNLLSVRKMQQAGMEILFHKHGATIKKDGKIIIKGKLMNNLMAVEFTIKVNKKNSNFQAYNIVSNNYKLWHQRLGHIGRSKFLELKNKIMVNDVQQIEKILPGNEICEACIKGKQARLPFEKAKDKSYIKRPLFNVHSDVCGPITPPTIDNKNYFVLFLDEFTHYCATYVITYKSDVFSVFKDYIAKSEAHFNLKVVNLYCDNGREYLPNEMKDFCVQKGISYHLTVPRTPQLNGVSERMVRTITEKSRAMIIGADLDKMFWGEAVLTATYLINITPSKAVKRDKTPYEMWHDKKPQLKYLKVFGSTVYIHNKVRKTKFDEKSFKGILVGYEPNGYKVWDTENEKFIVVRDVVVDEINYLVSRPAIRPERVNIENSSIETDAPLKSVKRNEKSDNEKSDILNPSNKMCANKNVKSNYEFDKSVVETDIHKESDSTNGKIIIQQKLETRRSDRIKSHKPISYNEDEIPDNCFMCAQTVVYKIPNSFKEIENRNDKIKWECAIKDEIDSLLFNNTWTLVPKPEGKNIVDCKWIFTIKNDEHGNPLKYKARLVARGFSQKYLVDYNETFAPVARIASFRFIIAFSNQFKLLIHHMDVKTAFLNGILKEEIYMKVPEGVVSKSTQVCKLNRAIYGLKQAARCWFEVFEKVLTNEGFKNSSVDRCIYILDKGNISKNIYLVLYVDDLVIATASNETMKSFKTYLNEKFRMTDLNSIKCFIGIKIDRNGDRITLDQSAYIKTVLNKFKMNDCKAVSTPLPSKLNYEALNSDEEYDAPCRNLIGCLMYLMVCTRPDLSIAINILSRYSNKNNKELWQCLKRVLRYLKGSVNIKLNYVRYEYNDLLSGYVDSDWGGNDETDRKSTTGYLFKLYEQCIICWNTKRQHSVAASSTEAEYMALYEAVRETLWLKSLANSININIINPITIYEDNNGCISIASNPTNHKRSKHIDIKYHFSREQVEKNVIKLNYIPTGDQLADALTKPLPSVKFLEFRSKIGLQ